MICYRLHCAIGHEFEGWYKDSQTFSRLQNAGLLSCPECGDTRIKQALVAPAILKGKGAKSTGTHHTGDEKPLSASSLKSSSHSPLSQKQNPSQSGRVPDALVGAMQRMREVIEKNCDHVGKNFAQEALRMHHGQAPRRNIYGDVSESDRELLESEGVSFQTIPWVRKADS